MTLAGILLLGKDDLILTTVPHHRTDLILRKVNLDRYDDRDLVTTNLVEMERNKSFAFCCGGGGTQMFKEAEKGNKEVYTERTEEALRTDARIIATACPFCMTMITDGIKNKNREEDIKNFDIAELIVQSLKL